MNERTCFTDRLSHFTFGESYLTVSQPGFYMPKEKSVGAVVYRLDKSPLFLLLHYAGGHWGFPKGHREAGESKEETARREIVEETALKEFEFTPGFLEKIQYFYKREGKVFNKTVHYLVARTSESRISVSHEHQGFEWLSFREAYEKLTFDNDRETLAKAKKFIQEKEGLN